MSFERKDAFLTNFEPTRSKADRFLDVRDVCLF
jgi:hypothetical protein